MATVQQTKFEEAYSRLLADLALAISTFADATLQNFSKISEHMEMEQVKTETDDVEMLPNDPIPIWEIRTELKLKTLQIKRLQQFWKFPTPWDKDGMIYSRKEIEEWVRHQPDKDNLGAVLRRRPRKTSS